MATQNKQPDDSCLAFKTNQQQKNKVQGESIWEGREFNCVLVLLLVRRNTTRKEFQALNHIVHWVQHLLVLMHCAEQPCVELALSGDYPLCDCISQL